MFVVFSGWVLINLRFVIVFSKSFEEGCYFDSKGCVLKILYRNSLRFLREEGEGRVGRSGVGGRVRVFTLGLTFFRLRFRV